MADADTRIAEACIKALEIAGFDPHAMDADDSVVFFGTAMSVILQHLPLAAHQRAVATTIKKLEADLARRARRH